MQESMFSSGEFERAKPLAERMRPNSLSEFVGQQHILGKGKLLRRLVETGKLGSTIFFGPPGTGKTTLAEIIAKTEGANFVKLNAVSSGVADAKKVIEQAKTDLALYGKRTYLLLDECHRWSKAQSDSVLGAVEKGEIIFIGSTTENPFYSMTRALVSRCRIFEFKPLGEKDILSALNRSLAEDKVLREFKLKIDPQALKHFANSSGGDLRSALGALELAVISTPSSEDGTVEITPEIASECTGKPLLSVDEDIYFDMLSAFGKSLRGTDPDAAVYWAMRMIDSGVDPEIILRRLIAHSSEDVGLANNNALNTAVSALTAYKNLGVPEGLIPLVHAVIVTATSPKSNSVVVARDKANELVRKTKLGAVPDHLKNYNFLNEKRDAYKYPHSYGGYVSQQYLPTELVGEQIYLPSENGNEAKVKEFLQSVREANEYTKNKKSTKNNK